ncbi:RimK family alpha-L-glutamate ligase [Streptomyces sp. NPDC058308]|uniref:ATP-grasp domain-containing protein n=1 Tax=Streptomyces sp. NPDC058308 TaxID=3346440 RepID=UPI0036EDFEB0
MASPRIALVTRRPRPEHDTDLPVLARAVGAAGGDVRVVGWDDPDVDWSGFDLAVIRSTWDYSWRTGEYVAWAERCASLTRLANPADVVRWNTDKRYLGELAEGGVPVVPTYYRAPGQSAELPAIEGEFVVKPTSGAGARYAGRYRADEREAARAHIAHLHEEGFTAMVQPYMTRIDATGERALVFFGGQFLHAIQKGAVLAPGTAYDDDKMPHPDLRPWEPTAAELDVAERALAAVPGSPELLYARVDLVDGADGGPRVMELELVEPNLFLGLHPGSPSRVAELIVKTAYAS